MDTALLSALSKNENSKSSLAASPVENAQSNQKLSGDVHHLSLSHLNVSEQPGASGVSLLRSSQVVESDTVFASYFLTGNVFGKRVQFLIDSGSTANILAVHVFERLSNQFRDRLGPYDSQGVLADGSPMEILGMLEASGKLGDIAFTTKFLICPIREDAILGMPFLEQNGCMLDFAKQCLMLKDEDLKCVDRHGNRLQSKIQVVHDEKILPFSEKTVKGRLCSSVTCKVGLVEPLDSPTTQKGLLIGASLNRVDSKQNLPIRCMNATEEPPLYSVEDEVVMRSKRKRKGQNYKLSQKFVGPYKVTKVWPNHTYKVERNGQASIQNEACLKPFNNCDEEVEQAPIILEPSRRPNMKGARQSRPKEPPDPPNPGHDILSEVYDPGGEPSVTETPPQLNIQEETAEEQSLRPRRSLRHYVVDYKHKVAVGSSPTAINCDRLTI